MIGNVSITYNKKVKKKKGRVSMKRYIDKEQSLKIYERNKEYIQKKECYSNVFRVITNDPFVIKKIKSEEWMIEYGYINITDNLYTRHAYLVDTASEKVIDPTMPVYDGFEQEEAKHYYRLHQFKYNDYLDAILKESNMPALTKHLWKKDLSMQKKMMEQNMFCIG